MLRISAVCSMASALSDDHDGDHLKLESRKKLAKQVSFRVFGSGDRVGAHNPLKSSWDPQGWER
jgi:hypothetical protein